MHRLIEYLFFLILSCFIYGCMSTPDRQALIPYNDSIQNTVSRLQKINSLDDLRSLPATDFDLAQAVLFINLQTQPDIDVDRYIDYIDNLSAELAYHARNKKSGKEKAALISDFIWEKGFICDQPYWMSFKTNQFYEMWLMDYSNFVALLDTKKGNCMTFSLLYLILAQRVGFPIYGALIPSHIFVRFDDGNYVCNMEPTNNGHFVSDYEYFNTFRSDFDHLAPLNGSFEKKFSVYYLRNLTNKQTLGCFLMNVAMVTINNDNFDDGLRLLLLANQLNPVDPDILNNLGNVLAMKKRYDIALDAYNRQLSATPFKAKAYYNIGAAYKELGNPVQAEHSFKLAVEEKPYTFHDYWSITLAHYELGDYDTALARMDKIVHFDNKHCRAWYYKARVSAQQQDYSKAIDCLSKAVTANPISKRWAVRDNVFIQMIDDPRFRRITEQ
ncbi:MAG: transglutaminase family protein [Candidatus Auribacterota bacterium]|nr:transglutaminase family protein [Candidatus Auribacterota bacterium]